MNTIAAIEALVALFAQLQPLVAQVLTAAKSNDQATLDAVLAKLQAANDALMAGGAS